MAGASLGGAGRPSFLPPPEACCHKRASLLWSVAAAGACIYPVATFSRWPDLRSLRSNRCTSETSRGVHARLHLQSATSTASPMTRCSWSALFLGQPRFGRTAVLFSCEAHITFHYTIAPRRVSRNGINSKDRIPGCGGHGRGAGWRLGFERRRFGLAGVRHRPKSSSKARIRSFGGKFYVHRHRGAIESTLVV